MTLRTHTIEKKKDTHNQIWEWEETPELLKALEKLDESSKLAASLKQRTKKAPKAPNAATSKSKKKTVDKPSTEAS